MLSTVVVRKTTTYMSRALILLGLIGCGVRGPETAAAREAEVFRSASADSLEGPWSNRLEQADSPYLKMHGHDPVNWFAWGDEAFAEAERRQVPVFLSIGYYACHWCHVMHRESFKNPKVAAYLNDHFVAIKVDREERPDIDALYMDAVHLLNRNNGGWPASIWLTPDRKPFFAGTYFPPKGRYGRPGFQELLEKISNDWTQSPTEILSFAERTGSRLIQRAALGEAGDIPAGVAQKASNTLQERWLSKHRGWGERRQFPMTGNLQFLLWHGVANNDVGALELVRKQLTAMDEGGIHDHLGGGFHRYTVDPDWMVPHFEKMLYDNGQLLSVYTEASVALQEPRFAQVARDIADYLIRQMQHPKGAFYSSQSADSEGEEGTFYVWKPTEIRSTLSDADEFIAAFGVTEAGNFEHNRTVLIRKPGFDPETDSLRSARAKLYTARNGREHPPTDDKLVVAWNGLAIGGLARAGRLLGDPRYIEAAERAAQHVLAFQQPDGRLPRVLAKNAPLGVLEDYAFLCEGLLDLYEASGNLRWLKAANQTAMVMKERFRDPQSGAFFQADKDVTLLARKTDLTDGAEPSGPGRALLVLSRLRSYGAPNSPAEPIEQGLRNAAWIMERSPSSAPTIAHVVDRTRTRSTEVVIAVNDLDHPTAKAMIAAYNSALRPHTVMAVVTPEQTDTTMEFSALIGKVPGESGPRAYVCHDGMCKLPAEDMDTFTKQLGDPRPSVPLRLMPQ
jgi:uncharacterized protein YyaL (SSP411 family)